MNRNRVQMAELLKSGLALSLAVGAALQLMAASAQAELVVDEPGQGVQVTSADSVVAEAAPVAVVQQKPVPVAVAQAQAAPIPVQQVSVPAQAYPVQPIVIAAPQAPVAAPAPVAQNADSGERTSRTELVRRERMREEVRNEDILQERLEELRLQDEKRRTNQVLGVSTEAAPSVTAPLLAAQVAPVPAAGPLVTEQVVSVPVTERPASAGSSVASVSALEQSSSEDVTTLRLTPRGGLSGFSGQNPYNLQGRFSIGAGVDVGVSDHLTFEVGYSFNEYGVALNSATALGLTPVLGGGYGFNYDANNSTGVLKQNVVDAGIKLHLLGRQSKLRPFIGGGGGYSRSYLNYDPRIVDYLRKIGFGSSPDYDLTQFLAHASAGIELQLSKSVVVGLTYKYYTVLSSRQNQDLYNPALYGGYSPSYYGYGSYGGAGSLADLDKQYVGGSLASTSFYSVLGTLGFSF